MGGRNDLILWWPGRSAAGDPRRRFSSLQWKILEHGWRGFRSDFIDPAIDWAAEGGFAPRIWLHWPFGSTDVEPASAAYEVDAWTIAQKTLPALTDDYIEVMQGLRDEGVDVTTYHHSMRVDVVLEALARDRRAYSAYFDRAMTPAAATGSIGLDNVTSQKPPEIRPGHAGFRKVVQWDRKMRARGDHLYIEALPYTTQTWWRRFDALVRERTFYRRHVHGATYWRGPAAFPRWNPQTQQFDVWDPRGRRVLEKNVLTGQIVRLCIMTEDFFGADVRDKNAITAKGREVLQDGHTLAIMHKFYQNAGVKASDLNDGPIRQDPHMMGLPPADHYGFRSRRKRGRPDAPQGPANLARGRDR